MGKCAKNQQFTGLKNLLMVSFTEMKYPSHPEMTGVAGDFTQLIWEGKTKKSVHLGYIFETRGRSLH